MLATALCGYIQEIESDYAICARNASTAAVHDRGATLQVYKLFPRDSGVYGALRAASKRLLGWEELPYWKDEGDEWEKIQRSVTARMKKHKELLPIETRGVEWEGRPVLIHAYKFEPDPNLKVELLLPEVHSALPKLPLQKVAAALRCHELLVPQCIVEPLAPYERHEAKFSTITEYLSRTMPKDLYATKPLFSSP